MESQKILFVIFLRLIKSGFGYIFLYLTVILFSPSIIGDIQFIIAFVGITSFIFNLGFDMAHLKIYPEEDNKLSCIGTLFFLKSIFYLIFIFFYILLVFFIILDPLFFSILIIFMINHIILNINLSLGYILIADNKILKEAVPGVLFFLFRIIFLIILTTIFTKSEFVLASVYILSTLFHTGFLLVYIKNYKINKPTKSLIKKYYKYTVPLIFSSITIIVSYYLGTVLIKIWISSEAVAFYYAGDSFSVFRKIIPSVINLVMVSYFSRNLIKDKKKSNENLIKPIEKYSCIIYGGIILLSFLYSDELIIIFIGEVYHPSIFIFNILILTEIFLTNNIAVETDLFARGQTKLLSILQIIGEIYYIILQIFFIAPFGLNLGINGIAIAIFFKTITYTPIVRYYLWKKHNYHYYFRMFYSLFAALIVFFFNYLIMSNINLITHFYLIPILMIFNLILYFGILYMIREITKEDISYFRLLLNIKNLKKIFFQELAINKENIETHNHN